MGIQERSVLSEADLDCIERRLAAATAGPWISYVVGRDADAVSTCIELGMCNELGSFRAIELRGANAADQDFIASARQDIPRLLAEIRLLRECLSIPRAEPVSPGRQALGSKAEIPSRPSASM
jgi:hypothetical protein